MHEGLEQWEGGHFVFGRRVLDHLGLTPRFTSITLLIMMGLMAGIIKLVSSSFLLWC